ncbi:MAG: VTT domain-containing protein [Pseudomonadota bacterium]
MSRALFAVLVIALLIILPFMIWGDRLEAFFIGDGTIEWFRSFGSWAWAAAIGLMVADILLPIPGSAVMAAMGIIYGPLWGGIVSAAGSILAGSLAYGVCRTIKREHAIWLTGAEGLERIEGLFERWGGWLVATSRWLPVLPEMVAILAGLSNMPARIFLPALACGSIPLGFAYATAGHLGAERPVLTLVIAAFVPLVLWFVFRKYLLSRPGTSGPETS